jgi:colanic acid biosynthesis glycosyl transferase WcaI
MLRQTVWMPDVVLTVAPAMACAPVGWLTARLCGAKAWLHVQDFEVDVAFQMNLLKGRFARALALWCERRLMRGFDKVSSISVKMVERLRAKGVDSDAIELFPNWVDTDGVMPLAGVSSYRREWDIPASTKVVLFSGTWGAKQSLLSIPAVARLLAHRSDVMFIVCGDGVMRPELEAACADLPNVMLQPLQPKERLGELLGLADVHLLTQSADAEDLVLPSKLTGMLSSGRPVIATCRAGTEIAQVVSRCGVVVSPDDTEALAQAVLKVVDAPEACEAWGEQARRYAEHALARDPILARWVMRAEPAGAALPVAVQPGGQETL